MNAPTAWTEYCKTLIPSIIEACALTAVAAGPGALAAEIGRRIPDRPFREVLCRGGWYRLGGVVAADGSRVAERVEEWAEAELARHDGDFTLLAEAFAGSSLNATRLSGRTHYFVSGTGNGAGDFLLLEIEDLQETLAHALFGRDPPPSTLEELVDDDSGRIDPASARPIGLPVYRFRRLSQTADTLNRMWAQTIEPQPIHRFFADWEASSAGRATTFCGHWVLALREHLDRYRNSVLSARPVPAINGEAPRFAAGQGTSGLALKETLSAFDRQCGYPFAWYFHLLTTRAVPHWVAATVVENSLAGFEYLPQRDLEVLRNWLHKPYGF
jgi:hypothetical protein